MNTEPRDASSSPAASADGSAGEKRTRRVISFTLLAIAVVALIWGFSKLFHDPALPPVQAAAPEIREVVVPRPITEVDCGNTYEFVHMERFKVEGRDVVNFDFGGKDRSRLSQYIVDKNVIGMSTEILKERRIDHSLLYSQVSFVCPEDPMLEGHKASNIELMSYKLTLRRPLRPQRVIRHGGPARQ